MRIHMNQSLTNTLSAGCNDFFFNFNFIIHVFDNNKMLEMP
jgi:hypothetical protein